MGLSEIARFFGTSPPELIFVLCTLITVPLGVAYKSMTALTSPKIKHIIHIFVGVSILYICYESHVLYHLFMQSIISYLLLQLPNPITSAVLTFIYAFTYCCYGHFTVLGMRPSLDISRPLMLQTLRVISVALSSYDHVKNPNNDELKPCKKPSLIEYFGYIFCFHNLMVGPFVFLKEYLEFINGYQVKDAPESKPLLCNKQMRRAIYSTLFHIGILLLFGKIYPWQYFKSEEFFRQPLLYKLVHFTIAGFIYRQRFYFAWALCELSMLSAGFGLTGVDPVTGDASFENAKNMKWIEFEKSNNIKEMWSKWNLGVQRWLKNTVYLRTPKPHNTWLVFITSALWHGLYPGYYLVFSMGALATYVTRPAHRHIRPLFTHDKTLKFLYDCVTYMGAICITNVAGCSFLILTGPEIIKMWSSIYFLPHLTCIAIWIVCQFLAVRRKPVPQKSS